MTADVIRKLQQIETTVEKAIEVCAKGLADGVLSGQKQEHLANLQKALASLSGATAQVVAANNPAAAKQEAPVNRQ